MVRIVQSAFNGGIISGEMFARTDTEKLNKGVRDAKNFIVRPQGGLTNRAGFMAASRHDTSGVDAVQYLLPFAFSTTQTYQLEFTDDVFRVMRDGAYVLDTSVGGVAVDSITEAAAAEIVLASSGDAASFPAGRLAYVKDPGGTHALDQAIVKITGATGASLTFAVYDGTSIDTTTADFGTLSAAAELWLVYEAAHPYDLVDLPRVRVAQDADTMYLAHPDYPPQKITRADHDDWTCAAVAFGNGIDPPTGLAATATLGDDAAALDPGDLTTYSYVVAAVDEENFTEGLPSAAVTIDNDLFYKGSINHLTWDAVAGASRYVVYKKFAGAYGLIGTTTDTELDDENITADTATGPRIDRVPFDGVGEYPSVVSFYEQRLVFASTDKDPQLVEASRAGSVENFCSSYPALADDAFRFRVRDRRVNRIRALVPSDTFALFTSGGEWLIAAQGDGEYIRPDKRKLAPTTSFGAADIEPLYTGSVVLYVEPSLNVVRDYRPQPDGTPSGDLTVVARDLFEDREIVSWAYAAAPNKLVWVTMDDGTLLTMTYLPEHDVWAWTRHEIAGEDAFAHQVSVTREDTRDVVYAVVSRTINGTTVTMTERLAKREDVDVKEAYFVDGGLKQTYASETSVIGGLLHLRGEDVVVLADGDVIEESLTVDDRGRVDISPRKATQFSVGLAYEALVQSLDAQFEITGMGSSEGRMKATSEVVVKMRRSRGLEVGSSLDRMTQPKEWTADLIGGPIPLRSSTALVSITGDWERDAHVFVRQRHPLPATVLSIAPDWEVGE